VVALVTAVGASLATRIRGDHGALAAQIHITTIRTLIMGTIRMIMTIVPMRTAEEGKAMMRRWVTVATDRI
jgi:hypothetical protein